VTLTTVILADEFLKVFDGSIGSNDLTQLILGLDHDSGTVTPLDEGRTLGYLEGVGGVQPLSLPMHFPGNGLLMRLPRMVSAEGQG
jgi:hypothetical protein